MILLMLVGCMNKTVKTDFVAEEQGMKSAEEMVNDRISSSAQQIREDLTLLAKLSQQNAVATNQIAVQPKPVDSVLNHPFPMHWNGPLEPAMKVIAKSLGWKLEIVGVSPIQPIIIQVESKDDSAYSIIETAGYQAGKYVAVVASENAELIRIIYLPEREG